MFRPSTSRGRPALGCATSRAGDTSAIRSIVSSIAAGPTLQLRPMTSTARAARTGVNCSGGAPSAVRPSSPVVIWATIGSRETARTPRTAAPSSLEVAERFQHEEVDAALGERLRLLAKCLLRFVETGLPPGLDANAQRPDRAGDVGLFARHVTRDLRPLLVDRPRALGEAERGELDAIGAERVGLENVGAGAEIVPVHFRHQVVLRQVQIVETAIEEDALGIEHRSHRPVADQDALVERFEKGLHGSAGPPARARRMDAPPAPSRRARAGPLCPR